MFGHSPNICAPFSFRLISCTLFPLKHGSQNRSQKGLFRRTILAHMEFDVGSRGPEVAKMGLRRLIVSISRLSPGSDQNGPQKAYFGRFLALPREVAKINIRMCVFEYFRALARGCTKLTSESLAETDVVLKSRTWRGTAELGESNLL